MHKLWLISHFHEISTVIQSSLQPTISCLVLFHFIHATFFFFFNLCNNGSCGMSFVTQYSTSRGVYGTPFFFVNGFLLPDGGSTIDYKGWRSIIDPLIGAHGVKEHFFLWRIWLWQVLFCSMCMESRKSPQLASRLISLYLYETCMFYNVISNK